MVRDRGAFRSTFGALALMAAVAGLVPAQQAAPIGDWSATRRTTPSSDPKSSWPRALRSNPLTAPYAISATWRDGTVILSGRVGTKQVHDAAVQMAIAFGLRFRDDLVIDTAETMRVAMSATPSMTGYGALAPNLSASYYVYPQPLFGWLDDPFFGMQPPVVSFAPWWRARRDGPTVGPNGGGPMPPRRGDGVRAGLRRTGPFGRDAGHESVDPARPRRPASPARPGPPGPWSCRRRRGTSRSRSTPMARSSSAASWPARKPPARSSRPPGACRA